MNQNRLAEKVARVDRLIAQGVLLPSDRAGMEDDYITKWTAATYADALRGLSLYDQGLARLKQGDRSVFLHNSQGVLEDAYHHADHAYQIYYNGGPKGGDGMLFYGKYVAPMQAALDWGVNHGGFSAGGLQPMMANVSAPGVWQETRQITHQGKSETVLSTHDRLLQATAHLKEELPPVPEPVQDIVVRSGEPCPVFGIYEPQVKDGLMAYMCQGQEAYRYGEPVYHPGGGQPVAWKLMWEDTRYLDGQIPEEESTYYPQPVSPPDFLPLIGAEPRDPMDNWRSEPSASQVEQGSCDANQPCPRTGYWVTPAKTNSRRLFKQGELMPDFKSDYGMTIWQWDTKQS